ncbi:MAG: hypothetical protein JRM85_08395 [Nitrososphaerota archaeon]|jgi:hypothetical protein|nr:hypothetical protein [Nitrososphaerota archaeon]
MTAPYLLTVVAAMAFVPTIALLFVALDPYTEPRVDVSLFEERKVFLCFAVGLPGSIPLALVFLLFTGAVGASDLVTAAVWAIVFVLVASLGRRIFFSTKTFGGAGGSDPTAPVFGLSFGAVSGATVFLGLAIAQIQIGAGPSPETLALLGVFSVDLGLLEGWAGLRAGERLREGFSWFPPADVLGLELVGLLLLGLPFLGIAGINVASLAVLLALDLFLLYRDAPRILGRLRKRTGRTGGGQFARLPPGSKVLVSAPADGERAGEAETRPPSDPPLPP